MRRLALVILKEDHKRKVLEDDIKAFFKEFMDRGVISKWGVPDKVFFVDSIPETSFRKLDKKEIRRIPIERVEKNFKKSPAQSGHFSA